MVEHRVGAAAEPEASSKPNFERGRPVPGELTGLRARALRVLGGEDLPPDQLVELAKRLARYQEIGYARRVMKRARDSGRRIEPEELRATVFQKSALFTYKDPDLPAEWRLDRALEILGELESIEQATAPETLGLAGAIHKRKWEVDLQRRHLDRALSCYLKGYAQGAPPPERTDVLGYLRRNRACRFDASRDRGYCAINAAFVLDLLASEEEAEARRLGLSAVTAAERRADAALIREEIVRTVPPLREEAGGGWLGREWWFLATIGEAFFGLGRFEEAMRWLVDEPVAAGLKVGFDQDLPAELVVPEWEYESTARQLARLARLQQPPGTSDLALEVSDAGRALRQFLREDNRALSAAFRGKIGLALSGGGFRAALFHVGVLAQLAERDLLRQVEVISCVSGGSIVGAHYYLKLQHLLETRRDEDIGAEDYLSLVRELEKEFLAGVQKNIRMRVLAEFTTNLKMIFLRGYSRTQRVGELYESEIFARVKDDRRGHRWMDDLLVRPLVAPGVKADHFHPRYQNWRRQNKVPTLVLNATSLNTGHNWQFTASYMGEPPRPIHAEIDSNERLRRMYYGDAPVRHRRIRLGHAVAASSCVPGLFEPLILDGLYPDRSVRLVDGGVCDNQGVSSLLEQDCTVVLVSDGSGQMESQPVPNRGLLGVPLRSNSILQARVRETQFGEVTARRRAGALRGLLFVHLKQDLRGPAVTWNDCPPEQRVSEFERSASEGDRLVHGIDVDLQRKLAAIRTDLDSFCDAEAYALMASGYRLAAGRLGAGLGIEVAAPAATPPGWQFLRVARDLEPGSAGGPRLARLLGVSSHAAFKIWSLWPPLIVAKWVLAVTAVGLVAWALWRFADASLVPPTALEWARRDLTLGQVGRWMGWFVALTAATMALRALVGDGTSRSLMRVARVRETLQQVAIGIAMSLFGFLAARLHLHVFDRLYLWYGKASRFHAKYP